MLERIDAKWSGSEVVEGVIDASRVPITKLTSCACETGARLRPAETGAKLNESEMIDGLGSLWKAWPMCTWSWIVSPAAQLAGVTVMCARQWASTLP